MLLVGLMTPGYANAGELPLPNHIVISEIQTGSSTSASQEFVELYNPTDQPVNLEGWQIEYRPASDSSSWTNRTSEGLHNQIKAHGFYLIAPTTYLPTADAGLAAGIAAGGGSIKLVDASDKSIDLVGWGTAIEFEGSSAKVPAAGESLERLPGLTNQNGGNWHDEDDNQGDFVARSLADPQSSTSQIEDPGYVGLMTTPNDPPDQPADQKTESFLPVQINELLIDPVAPMTDSKDEFIELYNPNPVAIDLSNYTLKTGSNFHDSYRLPPTSIIGGSYIVLYSGVTKLSLTNSSGAAELLDASGEVVDQTANYDGSMPGLSFSRFGNDWQWTKTLTPGSANQYIAPDGPASSVKAKAAPKASAKKAATKKSSAGKVAKVAAQKAKSAAKLLTDQKTGALSAKWLIIGLGALTMGYAIYEFRYDIQNYYVRAKRKYQAWRTPRPAASRRRGH
jgi:hypothetical protein